LIDDAGPGLTALATGEVALLAVSGGTLIDFTMVDLHEVDRVALRRPAEEDPYCREDQEEDERDHQEQQPCSPGPILDLAEDGTPYTIVEQEPQTARMLEAIPLRGSLPLAGRFDYTWKSLDPVRLTVSPRSRGRVFLDFHGPWAAELQVTMNGASHVILVRAPGSDEVPDPHRTGGLR
jgi:hypothetical protein